MKGSGSQRTGRKESKQNSKSHHSFTSAGSSSSLPGDVDFLFAITQLQVNDCTATGIGLRRDVWGNFIPPLDPEGYGPEVKDHIVYRYKDGDVRGANDYCYDRDENGDLNFYKIGQASNPPDVEAPSCFTFRSTTLFNCGNLLPVLIAGTDVLNHGMLHDGAEVSNSWKSLRLAVSRGIYRVSTHHEFYNVGPHMASWIPSIVPLEYQNRTTDGPYERSLGLGGDFGIIIGLMALAQAPHNIGDAFGRLKLWKNYTWAGTRDDQCKWFSVHLKLCH